MKYTSMLIFTAFLLSACSEDKQLNSEDKAVARAGSSYITKKEVDYQLGRFKNDARLSISQDKQQYQRLLESIAITRIMADKQLAAMSPDQIKEFELSVQVYRNQMLAKSYMADNLERHVPDRQAVEDYYNTHSDEFGAGKLYSIREISVPDNCTLKKEYLTPVLDQKLYEKLQKSGCEFITSAEHLDSKAIAGKYSSIKESVSPKKAYWSTTSGNQVLVYINDVSETAAKPLSEAASEIRKRLAPKYLKQSLEKERMKLRKEIEFFE